MGYEMHWMYDNNLLANPNIDKILKELGIDITSESFWQKGFDIIRAELEELKKLA